tara:strand:- start:2907 stop:3689 length:783 start_codon:yes stop_codon:yes gene_type:complete
MTWEQACDELRRPFNDKDVYWRIDRSFGNWARVLCYVDARAVMDRLDSAVGSHNWQDAYIETSKGKNICTLSICVGGTWVSKSDGAGDTAFEGDKGGLSDAFKRAAVKWGVGRHLYELGETKVQLSEARPDCPPEYLVVCTKRGEKTKYGVAPSIQQLQADLFQKHDPRERRLERIRFVLRENKVKREFIPFVLETATAISKDSRFFKRGLKDIDPTKLDDERLKILSQRLLSWHEAGKLAEMLAKYELFIGGDEPSNEE